MTSGPDNLLRQHDCKWICLDMETEVASYIGIKLEILIKEDIWPRGYKTFFMLSSTEHENFPAQS